MIVQKQYEYKAYAGFYNVGPDERDCITTETLVDTFCAKWGEGLTWINQYDGDPHEANFYRYGYVETKKYPGVQKSQEIVKSDGMTDNFS